MMLTADYIPSVSVQLVNASTTVIQGARNVMIVLIVPANTASPMTNSICHNKEASNNVYSYPECF